MSHDQVGVSPSISDLHLLSLITGVNPIKQSGESVDFEQIKAFRKESRNKNIT